VYNMIGKNWGVVAEIFPLEGAAVFDRGLFKSTLSIGCKSHMVSVCVSL